MKNTEDQRWIIDGPPAWTLTETWTSSTGLSHASVVVSLPEPPYPSMVRFEWDEHMAESSLIPDDALSLAELLIGACDMARSLTESEDLALLRLRLAMGPTTFYVDKSTSEDIAEACDIAMQERGESA